MTAPATFNSPLRIITYAARESKLIARTADPSSDLLAEGMNRLNDMINMWTTQGLKLWLNVDTNIPLSLTKGINPYTIGLGGDVDQPKPLRVIDGYFLTDPGTVAQNRRPIYPMAWSDWMRLSTILQSGQINSYFANKQQTTLNVNFWLIPDSVAVLGEAHLLLQNAVTHFTGLSDTMNFPVEWFSALRWGLASDWASGQPDAITSRCDKMASSQFEALNNWDVEDAPTQFQPDQRMGQDYGKFR